MGVLQNLEMFRVLLGMKALQNFQKFWVLCHGRTELAEVPGTGNSVIQNLQMFRVRVIPG